MSGSDTAPLSQSDTDTVKTTGSDYSTLTRLKKNINELDYLIEGLDQQEKQHSVQSQSSSSVMVQQTQMSSSKVVGSSNISSGTFIKQSTTEHVEHPEKILIDESSKRSSSEDLLSSVSQGDEIDPSLAKLIELDITPLPPPAPEPELEPTPNNQIALISESKRRVSKSFYKVHVV